MLINILTAKNITTKGIKMAIKELPFKSKLSKSDKVLLVCQGGSRTKQSFKDETDINNILKKYKEHGRIPDISAGNPQFGDFSQIDDYQGCLNTVIAARQKFDSLPEKIRNEFSNDPGKFLNFVGDPKNGEKLVSLGLATQRVAAQEVPKQATQEEVKK